MRKILVLRGGALGDFIVTLPALASLRERWPRATIELIGNAPAAKLARARGLLDAVHSQHESRWSALFSDAPLPAALGGWLAAFDLVLNYWPDPDGAIRRRFPRREGQLFRSAEAMPACAPAAKHYCEPLRTLGIEPKQFYFPIAPLLEGGCPHPPDCAVRAPRLHQVRGHIAVHPGSGSTRKNWPAENWRALLRELPPPLSLILGEAEMSETVGAQTCCALLSVIDAGRSKSAPLQLLNRPLEELIAHLAQCRLFLGHDSGISHLAAACGVPCVLLFGPTNPAVWAPPAPNVRVLRRCPGLNSISVEDVLRAAAAALADRT